MKVMKTGWLLIAGTIAFGPAAFSLLALNSEDHPYRNIVTRNTFGLRDPLPPVAPPQPPPKETVKKDIYLTGIHSLFGPPKAFLMVEQQGQTEPAYFDLGVRESRDGIEVLEINDVARTVRIRDAGNEVLLSFDTHGRKAPAPAPMAATPAAAARAQAVAAARGGQAQAVARGVQPIPGQPAQAQIGAGQPYQSSATGAQPTARSIPSRSLRVQPDESGGIAMDPVMAERYGLSRGNRAPPHQDLHHNLSSEEQLLMMELQRAANPQVPLPPTPVLDSLPPDFPFPPTP